MKRIGSLLLSLALLAFSAALAEEAVAFDETLTYAVDADQAVLTVTLIGNATTGYEWTVVLPEEDALLAETSSEYVLDDKGAETAGAGGRTVITLEAAPDGAGMATLTFAYARAWEAEEPARVYEMDVLVDEAGLLSVEEVRRTVPRWEEGDKIVCPECEGEEATVTEVVIGGDEETGPVYFITIECPNCGTVVYMPD